jgi:hypothetical protein
MVVVLGALSACSSGDETGLAAVAPAYRDNSANAESSPGYGPTAGDQDAPSRQEKTAESNSSQPPAGGPQVTERKLARTARLELTAPKPAEAAGRARDIVTVAGGYASNEQTSDNSASITMRVPADQLSSVLNQLVALGTLTLREEKTDDVTEQVVDVASRLANQKESVERVRALLARAVTVAEIVQIESELTSREAEYESLQARRDALAGKVAFATVTLRVTRDMPPAVPDDEPGGFLGGLAAGWDAMVTAVVALLTALGAVLPFLGVLAVLVMLGWLVWRRRRPARKPRVAAPAAAEPAPEEPAVAQSAPAHPAP